MAFRSRLEPDPLPKPPARCKLVQAIVEKDGQRGLVPSSSFGKQDVVYNNYLDALNPREDESVQLALAASTDKRFQYFLEQIHISPKKVSLAAMAKRCDISLLEFMEWVGKAHHARALIVAQCAMPKLNEDLVEDALNKSVTCDRCDGLGFAVIGDDEVTLATAGKIKGLKQVGKAWTRPCPLCKGTGEVRQKGDAHARDKLLDMTGLAAKKSAAPSVVVNFGGNGLDAATDRLNKISFGIEEPDATPVIDVLPTAAGDSE